MLGSSNGQNGATSNLNVGIGTTTPSITLHIRNDATSALGPTLTLMNGSGGAEAGASIDTDGYDPDSNPPTACIPSIDDGIGSSSVTFSTKSPGAAANPLVEQVRITDWGVLVVDSSGTISGALNNGAATGTGLTFGVCSGEGIASKRTAGGNQYGLDFYTGFSARMEIFNGGTVNVTGCLQTGGSTLGGGCPSDARLKTTI